MAANNLRDSIENAKLRRDHNQDLIRRMRNGESLTSFDSQASWFPPRPTIAKDPDAIAKLYGKKANSMQTTEEKKHKSNQDDDKVVRLIR